MVEVRWISAAGYYTVQTIQYFMLLLPFSDIFPVRGPNEEMKYNVVIALLSSDELYQLYIINCNYTLRTVCA